MMWLFLAWSLVCYAWGVCVGRSVPPVCVCGQKECVGINTGGLP